MRVETIFHSKGMRNRSKEGGTMSDAKLRSVDPATVELLEKAEKDNVSTAFFRADTMKPCPIGVEEKLL